MESLIFFVAAKLAVLSVYVSLVFVFVFFVGALIEINGRKSNVETVFGKLGLTFVAVVIFFGVLAFAAAINQKGAGTYLWSVLTRTYTEQVRINDEDAIQNKRKEKVRHQTEVMRFMLVEFDPPKHAYVTLKHIPSGTIYGPLSVGKHCGTHPQVHQEYNVQVTPFHYDNDTTKVFYEFNNLKSEFCE